MGIEERLQIIKYNCQSKYEQEEMNQWELYCDYRFEEQVIPELVCQKEASDQELKENNIFFLHQPDENYMLASHFSTDSQFSSAPCS